MHDETFPESEEPVANVSSRFERQLRWEERAGTGFRRRQRGGQGDPFGDPEPLIVDREDTDAELIGGLMAGFGTMLGAATLVYKPLLLAFPAMLLILAGTAMGGQGAKVGRIGIIVLSVCFLVGMIYAISFDQPVT